MPIALDPNQTTLAYLPLDCDAQNDGTMKPHPGAVAFRTRYITSAQRRKIEAALIGPPAAKCSKCDAPGNKACPECGGDGEVDPGRTLEEVTTQVIDAIRPVLVAIENSPTLDASATPADQLPQLLSDHQIQDVARAIIRWTVLGYMDLKKSKSRQASGAA